MKQFSYTFLLFFVLLTLSACESYNNIKDPLPSVSGEIVDTESWYADANNDVLVMNIVNPIPNEFLCAPSDDPAGTIRPCTMADIDADSDPYDLYEPTLHVNMATSTFTSAPDIMNGVLKIKGEYTRFADQKSYSLKLDSKTDLFNKQRKFMLTKSQSDRSRMRNKLAFDLCRIIPNIPSLKVQFFHVFINSIDYGLFNQPEAIRKEYLVNRGWNEDDHLYNAVEFLFRPLDELALTSDGEPVEKVEFEKFIEIKNGKEHSKLNEMINAVATTDNIDAVIATYFNRDNYMTWLAINMVLNNKDTIHHNFYLLNPLHSNTFYFLPWDYDGAWSSKKYLGKNEYGISAWWQSELHKKFLSVAKNRDDLYLLADELRANYITDAFIQRKIAEYENSVRGFQSIAPDNAHNSDASWLNDADYLWRSISDNITLYKDAIGDPMPFSIRVGYTDTNLTINWDESIDFEGDTIVYDLIVSSDANISNNAARIINVTEINATSYTQNINLSAGAYYVQVISKELNNPSNYQISYRQEEIDGTTYYGIVKLEVE
jgi:spore coat protein H